MTGNEQIDHLQDGVNNLVAGQVGQGGIAQPIGDMASREGFTRAERQGRDDKGSYLPGAAEPLAAGGEAVVGGVSDGLRGAGGLLAGLGGGQNTQERK